MSLKTLAVSTALLTSALAGAAAAAPVPYTFSTGALRFNNPFSPNGLSPTSVEFGISNSIASQLAGTTISGTFVYDNQAQVTGATTSGSLGTRGSVYGGHLLPDGTPYSSFTALSATVNGTTPRSITDPRGFTIVGDDDVQFPCFTPGCTPPTFDFFGYNAENLTGTTFRNIVGFTIGAYRVFNVRLFWQEGQEVPNPVPDFLANADEPARDPLPNTPPTLNGRLAIDFVHVSNTDGLGFQYAMFYDGLSVTAVPEPETYALLLVGLGLLGFAARRRYAA
jgi:hypothetical protein